MAWTLAQVITFLVAYFVAGYIFWYVMRWFPRFAFHTKHEWDDWSGWAMLPPIFFWSILVPLCAGIWVVRGFVAVIRMLLGRFLDQVEGVALATVLDTVLARLTRRTVHKDSFGVLFEYRFPDRTERRVEVQDHTGKHMIPVPPNMERAKQAVAWSYRIDENKLNPIVRV